MSISEQDKQTAKDVMPLLVFPWLVLTVGALVYLHYHDRTLWLAVLPSGYVFVPVAINIYQAYLTKAKRPGTIEWYLSPIFYLPLIILLVLIIHWGQG